MTTTVTPAPSESPNTAARSMIPNGRSRPRRDRASSENASLHAGRIGSLTPPPARASSATRGCAARPLGEERVEPGDRELDVVWIGLAQASDPVGQAPEWVVAAQCFSRGRQQGLDRLRAK